jgi:hypothetical protein
MEAFLGSLLSVHRDTPGKFVMAWRKNVIRRDMLVLTSKATMFHKDEIDRTCTFPTKGPSHSSPDSQVHSNKTVTRKDSHNNAHLTSSHPTYLHKLNNQFPRTSSPALQVSTFPHKRHVHPLKHFIHSSLQSLETLSIHFRPRRKL